QAPTARQFPYTTLFRSDRRTPVHGARRDTRHGPARRGGEGTCGVTRRLVLTADDLGREEGSTTVIAALLADGYITATTLITVSRSEEHTSELQSREKLV